jgi:hypothetical protein
LRAPQQGFAVPGPEVEVARMKASKAVRSVAVAFIAATTVAGTAQTADAAPANNLTANLAALWTTVLQTPKDQNSFGTGGQKFACWDLGGNVVAPLAPPPGAESCTVKPGTKIFVAWTGECSTFEVTAPPCDDPDLAKGARASIPTPTVTSVTVDDRTVSLTEVTTSVQPITLPANNLFGAAAGSRGQFVADGWVTLLNPLTPGRHTIIAGTVQTTIVVQPGLN